MSNKSVVRLLLERGVCAKTDVNVCVCVGGGGRLFLVSERQPSLQRLPSKRCTIREAGLHSLLASAAEGHNLLWTFSERSQHQCVPLNSSPT